jgi:hypothetical protein
MPHQEQISTPAQLALLKFIDPLNAADYYDYIHRLLVASIVGNGDPEEDISSRERDSWYFAAELLKHIKNIATEYKPFTTQ